MKNLRKLYIRNIYSILLIVITMFINSKLIAQDDAGSSVSRNTPQPQELSRNVQQKEVRNYSEDLSRELKQALESGNKTESKRLGDEIEKFIPKENIYKTIYDNDLVIEKKKSNENTDWLTLDQIVYDGFVKAYSRYTKHIDMKMGEDGNMYLAINRAVTSVHTGRIDVFKSANGGLNWSWFLGFSSPATYSFGNLSMLVETRSISSEPDSTRIVIFYNRSTSSNDDNATLNYASFRRDGSAFYGGQIAVPMSAGYQISYLSAVSDGQFWSEGTYLGIVCSESSNDVSFTVRSLRVFRSTDWGATWIQSVLETYYDDHYPSADFKVGNGVTTDSIWIAVERRFTFTNTHIRVISANWNPAASFYTYFITAGTNLYEKPCLTIKQNNPIDSVIITTFKNGYPVYLNSINGGNSWNVDYYLGGNKDEVNSLTYCESSPNSTDPFVAIWVSAGCDSLNVRRGVVGDLGSIHHKKNNNVVTPLATPVCAVYTPDLNTNLASFSYSGPALRNVYADREDWRTLTLKVIPEGLYNPVLNRLNTKDTVRVKIRRSIPPYTIIDSAKSLIDIYSFEGVYDLNNTPPGSYYLEVKHRNSIETWSKFPVSLASSDIYYNFTSLITQAYGNNLKQVDLSPVAFAIYTGDVNQDGVVDATDVALIDNDASVFLGGYVRTDLTGDFFVDGSDLLLADNNAAYFVTSVTPASDSPKPPVNVMRKSDNNSEIELGQNFPNPFNPSTLINFTLKNSFDVKLSVYDVSGREVSELVNEKLNKGNYSYQWNGAVYSSGIYYFKLSATGPQGSLEQVRRMTLIK